MNWWKVAFRKWHRGWRIPPHPVRDSQRSKVYAAEDAINKHTRRLETVKEIQAYCDKLTGSAWAKRRGLGHQITVLDGRGKRHARGGWNKIWMPRWSRDEVMILHEIAHANGNWILDRHGPRFCAIFLDLIGHKMGRDVQAQLKASFKKHKVRFRPYRDPASARHLSPASLPAKRRPGGG